MPSLKSKIESLLLVSNQPLTVEKLATLTKAEAKAWKDIWGCGQGIGAVKSRGPVKDYVDQLVREFDDARAALAKGQAFVRKQTVTS